MDVHYEPWSFSYATGSVGHEWLASFEIEAENLEVVHSEFRKRLLNATPKIALISQCYTEFLFQPFIIRNIEKNHCYFFNIFDEDPVPLDYDNDSLDALMKLDSSNVSSEFFNYWNDATNTVGASPKLLLLFSAIEALSKDQNGRLDKAFRKELLGEELDTKFFESGNKGLRHRLVHGEYFQQNDFDQNYVLLIHQKVIDHFNNNIFKKELITRNVVGPQRHFDDNKLQGAFFIESLNDTSNLLLREILDDYDIDTQRFKGNFDFVFDISIKDY